MLRRPATVAAYTLSAVLVAGCGGHNDPKPKFAHSSSGEPTASSSVSSSAPPSGPPKMPGAAMQHTVAGARAFVKYYWDVANYSQTSLDWHLLSSLGDEHCGGCKGAVDFIKEVAKGHGRISGGSFTLQDVRVDPGQIAGQTWMAVLFRTKATPETVTYPGRRKDERYPGGTDYSHWALKPVPGGWIIDNWSTGR